MNSAHNDELMDLTAAYALGALPPQDAAIVRDHLRTCAECRAEYDALRPAVDALAQSAQACRTGENGPHASDLIKARVMRTVRQEAAPGSTSRPRPMLWPAYVVAAASVVLAIGTAVANSILSSNLHQAQSQIALLSGELQVANRNAAVQRQMVADLMSKDAQRFAFSDGEVVRRGDRMYIAMHAMHPPPKGHVYQAWTEENGAKTMAPSVTFMPDRTGVAVISLPVNASAIQYVAVSVEPEGGSKQPTTKPEFVVKTG